MLDVVFSAHSPDREKKAAEPTREPESLLEQNLYLVIGGMAALLVLMMIVRKRGRKKKAQRRAAAVHARTLQDHPDLTSVGGEPVGTPDSAPASAPPQEEPASTPAEDLGLEGIMI